jgi:large subunit ribosomal protein L10
MSRTKVQKKEILEKLDKLMIGAKSLVFVNIHGLKVEDTTTMRRQLTKDGVGFFVAKKTLTEKALGSKNYTGTMPDLIGEFGMAYGTDLVAPARGVYDFEKKLKGQVSIVGGVFEDKYMNKDEMLAIATIPPIQTLYGMFVNVINSPIQGFVVALSKIAEKGNTPA